MPFPPVQRGHCNPCARAFLVSCQAEMPPPSFCSPSRCRSPHVNPHHPLLSCPPPPMDPCPTQPTCSTSTVMPLVPAQLRAQYDTAWSVCPPHTQHSDASWCMPAWDTAKGEGTGPCQHHAATLPMPLPLRTRCSRLASPHATCGSTSPAPRNWPTAEPPILQSTAERLARLCAPRPLFPPRLAPPAPACWPACPPGRGTCRGRCR